MGKHFKNTHVKITQGRVGQEMEFTEFSYGRDKQRYIVQKGAKDWWFVYVMHPGDDGQIRTLTEFNPLQQEEAERYALNQLMHLVLGWE